MRLLATIRVLVAFFAVPAGAAELPMADAHIHYSHDVWELHPPEEAVRILREDAGLALAFVSSSSDEGTRMLYKMAPDLVVPVLRPYRRRGETSSWVHDETVIPHVEDRLSRYRYAGIGEFHASGEEVDFPVVRRMVALARQHGIFLHAHSDADAIRRIFAQDPDATVLWAHAGFEPLEVIAGMMRRYPRLSADLAFRSEHFAGGKVTEPWRAVFLEFPDRFLLGTDTYAPDRWSDVAATAAANREWLADLPPDIARRIAFENARAMADAALKR